MVEQIAESLEEGTFRPLIDRTFALEEIVAAYRYVESGQKIGNVLIRVAPPAEVADGMRQP